MTDRAEIIFMNDTFYHVFSSRDLDAMDALWARDSSVACIHPGWPALTARDDIIESWRGIFANPESPQVSCRAAEAHLKGSVAFVICYEIIGDNVLVATNIFIEEAGAWKLAHHQAGPCNIPLADLEEDTEPSPVQ